MQVAIGILIWKNVYKDLHKYNIWAHPRILAYFLYLFCVNNTGYQTKYKKKKEKKQK